VFRTEGALLVFAPGMDGSYGAVWIAESGCILMFSDPVDGRKKFHSMRGLKSRQSGPTHGRISPESQILPQAASLLPVQPSPVPVAADAMPFKALENEMKLLRVRAKLAFFKFQFQRLTRDLQEIGELLDF